MRSADQRGIVHQRLQMLQAHVLLVAPLGASHMTQARADEHQGRVPVRKAADHTSPPPDLTVEPFNDVVGPDPCPVLRGEITVSKRFLYSVLYFFAASGSFMAFISATMVFAFSLDAFLLSCVWIALSILATCFTLDLGTTLKTFR